jgi:hypothetical protein
MRTQATFEGTLLPRCGLLARNKLRNARGRDPWAQSTFSEICGRGVYQHIRVAETFPIAVNRFECLSWFNGMLLSGQVKVLKPDRRIFEIFLDTFRIEPSRAIYIDDASTSVSVAHHAYSREAALTVSAAETIDLRLAVTTLAYFLATPLFTNDGNTVLLADLGDDAMQQSQITQPGGKHSI